jgi:hypothetical protein
MVNAAIFRNNDRMGRTHALVVIGAMVGLGLWGSTARAQSLNVKFGAAGQGPGDTYAAAGLAGRWNIVQGQSSPQVTYNLLGLDGSATGVTLTQYGGNLMSLSDAQVTGDDGKLLNGELITFDPGLESCLMVSGLEPGTYEVLMYAWMPGRPAVKSRVRHDLSSMTVDVGGTWTGSHVEGVTYARHILTIDSSGYLGSHSGIVPGADASMGAALNGFQLRKMVPGQDGGPGPDASPPPDMVVGSDTGSGGDASGSDASVGADVVAPAPDLFDPIDMGGDQAVTTGPDGAARDASTRPHTDAAAGGRDAADGGSHSTGAAGGCSASGALAAGGELPVAALLLVGAVAMLARRRSGVGDRRRC